MTPVLLSPWQEVLASLMAGAVLGLGLLVWLTRSWDRHAPLAPSDPGAGRPLTLADVRETYRQAIAQLQELDEQGHAMEPAYVQRERDRLERMAAGDLKRMAELQQPRVAPRASRLGPTRRGQPGGLTAFLRGRPQLVGLMWGVSISALGTFLYSTVREGSAPRPGPPVMAPAEATAGAQALDKERFLSLQEILKAEPNNVPALLELSHMLLRVQMLDEAKTVNDRALQLDSNNLEALTHAAVLAASRGETAGSQAGLTAVLQKDPGFAEAWFFRGMLSMQAGDMDTMRESLQQFVRLAPDGPQKDRVRAMLSRAQATP